jgi:hypothetical protein
MIKDFKRNFPTYKTIQPSTGKEISFRPFLVSDEKNLLLIKEEKDTSLIVKNIHSLLTSCFPDIDPDGITLQDLEYLFCVLRSKSVGEIVKTNFTCPETGEKIKTSLDLSKLTVDRKNSEKEIIFDETFKILFKEPTVEKLLSIKGSFDSMHIAKACIHRIYKDDAVYDFMDINEEELKSIFDSFTVKEFEEIKKFVTNLPKAQAVVEYKTSDDKNRTMRLDGVLNFFTYV